MTLKAMQILLLAIIFVFIRFEYIFNKMHIIYVYYMIILLQIILYLIQFKRICTVIYKLYYYSSKQLTL